MIETVVVHLLLQGWNVMVAWALTGIGIYTLLQIVAILRSMDKRLITIDYESKQVHLRYGFASQSSIPFDNIASIEKSRKSLAKEKGFLTLSIFDLLDTHNLVIHLKEEQTLHKIYGIKRQYKTISVFIDQRDVFVEKVEELISLE